MTTPSTHNPEIEQLLYRHNLYITHAEYASSSLNRSGYAVLALSRLKFFRKDSHCTINNVNHLQPNSYPPMSMILASIVFGGMRACQERQRTSAETSSTTTQRRSTMLYVTVTVYQRSRPLHGKKAKSFFNNSSLPQRWQQSGCKTYHMYLICIYIKSDCLH